MFPIHPLQTLQPFLLESNCPAISYAKKVIGVIYGSSETREDAVVPVRAAYHAQNPMLNMTVDLRFVFGCLALKHVPNHDLVLP